MSEQAKVADYELEIDIAGPREAVWDALTNRVNAWWLPSFHMVGEGSVMTLCAEAGGHLIEKKKGGGSLLWFTVHMVNPGSSIHMAGYSFPEWGGPTVSMLKFALVDSSSGCTLRISDSHVGRITTGHIESLKQGWTELFTEGLKAFCEASPR